MSVVTNVLLTGIYSTPVAVRLNSWLVEQERVGQLVEVSGHAGGYKAMETHVWAGAFNYLEMDKFVEAYRKALFQNVRRDGIQLFVQRQDDSTFLLIDPRADVDYHYRSAEKDRKK